MELSQKSSQEKITQSSKDVKGWTDLKTAISFGWLGCRAPRKQWQDGAGKAIFFKDFIYLFLDRREGREKERERNISVWLPLVQPPPGAWPASQPCVLMGNCTSNPLVLRPVLNPLRYTSQGRKRHYPKCDSEPMKNF